MRWFLRLLAAHVLASYALQALFLVWVIAAGEPLPPIRGLMAVVFAPILVPVSLLGLGPRMRPIGRVVFWLLYLAALGSSLLLLRWRHSRRQLPLRRAATGLCPTCGYDLTGNASGTCPECGKAVTLR